MTQPKPLVFEGAVSDVKQKVGGEYGGGELKLTLSVKEPKRPYKVGPGLPIFKNGEWVPRPVPPAQKAKETDEAYKKRAEPLLQAQAGYDTAMARYRAEVARYQVEWEAYLDAIEDYMWLTGSAGIIGARAVRVQPDPLNRGFAEMEALLLPPPVDVTPESAPAPDEPHEVVIDATAADAIMAYSPDREERWPVEGADPPCPVCTHPLQTSHDDDEDMGGCAVILPGTTDGLCPCDVRLVAA